MPLRPFKISLAELAAAPHCDLGLQDLVAVPHRIVLRMKKRLYPQLLIGFENLFPGKDDKGDGCCTENHVGR